jgi:hypothetical protein
MVMTDEQIRDLINTLSDIFDDYIDQGDHPISVASVMLAVAVKQLKRNLDEEEFYAILDDLTANKFYKWDEMSAEEIEDMYIDDTPNNKKEIIH